MNTRHQAFKSLSMHREGYTSELSFVPFPVFSKLDLLDLFSTIFALVRMKSQIHLFLLSNAKLGLTNNVFLSLSLAQDISYSKTCSSNYNTEVTLVSISRIYIMRNVLQIRKSDSNRGWGFWPSHLSGKYTTQLPDPPQWG
jgi:hypothetical protein